MTENNLKLSPPWEILYREFEAMFKDDPDIILDCDNENKRITLYVDNEKKYNALSVLLPAERQYGNVSVSIIVKPSNGLTFSKATLFRAAFEGNPVFAYEKTVEGTYMAMNASYVVFKNRVVQFFTDDLGDANGLRSTLYQEIANDIFGEHPGVFFNTDIEEPVYNKKVGKPLGEWP